MIFNKRCFILFGFFVLFWLHQAGAQELNFRDTVKAYNKHRILTNASGALVLGGWGIANVAAGSAGYFAAKQDQWKYFHEMNAAWGLVNTGFAAYGSIGAGLTSYAQNNSAHAAMYKGFGRSIVVQGVALLAYDNFMFAAHQKYNHRWLQIIDEVRYTGYGFTFNHRF